MARLRVHYSALRTTNQSRAGVYWRGNFLKYGMVSITSLLIVAIIALAGIALALAAQSPWLMRAFIASLIALVVVVLLPDEWTFGVYGAVIVFCAVTTILLAAHQWRFFDADHWFTDRWSARACVFGVAFAFFVVATICFLVPYAAIPDAVMTKDIYGFLTEYYFYFVLAPITVALVGAR